MKPRYPQQNAFSSTVLTGFILFAVTLMAALLLPQYTSLTILAAWLLSLNLIAFLTTGFDKRQAVKRRFRIPDKVILACALAGGGPGVLLGLLGFHHKIRTGHFFIKIVAILLAQLLAVYCAVYFQVIPMARLLGWLIK